ncbi:MAG: class I SAM-dependent methyltransferase, partial [Bacteroidota bacterium]|nr:class I SAM-dependent methyltransferase [Bacteroidota bacterium]
MDIIRKYFPDLTDQQLSDFARLGSLYEEWNSKINVISRKDIEQLYERHILHSLAIAKVIQFKPGTTVLDVGTG